MGYVESTRPTTTGCLAQGMLALCFVLLLAPSSSYAQGVTATPYYAFQTASEPVFLTFSDDGQLLLAGDKKGNVTCWNLEQKVQVWSVDLDEDILFLAFLSGNQSFVAVDKSGKATIRSIRDGAFEGSVETQARPREVAFDARRRYLAIATKSGTIELFDLQARMPFGRIDAREQLEGILFLGFDRSGEQLMAITKRSTVALWDLATLRLIREISLRGGDIHGSRSVIHAAATNTATQAYIVGLEEVAVPKGGVSDRARPSDLLRRNMIIAYDWSSGLELKRIEYPEGDVAHVAPGPGRDHVVVTNERNQNVAFVDLSKGELGSTVTVAEKPTVLAVSEDNSWLAVGAKDKRVSVWELHLGERPTAAMGGNIRSLSGSEPAITPDTNIRLAILPFDDRGASQNIADISVDLLTIQLANVNHVSLLERIRINDLLDELRLQVAGITESDGARIGKMLNVDYVIMGSVGVLGADYIFSVRLLNVETSQIVLGRQVICEACTVEEIYDAIHLLGTTIAQ